MKTSKLLSAWMALLTAAVLLTAAISLPILCRPFYYAHITPMQLCEKTGLAREEIITAFDEMMDYCLGGEEFSTGVLAWSQEGKDHFTDVRTLFLLDLRVLCISAAALVVTLIVSRLVGIRPGRLLGRRFSFWAGAGLGGIFLIAGGLAALDFDRAFVIFHTLFFPGKDNWIFNPHTDQIINILPQDFFMHCAVLILAALVLGCIVLICSDLLQKPENSNRDGT